MLRRFKVPHRPRSRFRHHLLLVAALAACRGEDVTGPVPGADAAFDGAGTYVLVGAGNIGRCGSNYDEATARLLDGIPGVVFTAGDNVYTDGTLASFQNCFGPSWGRHKSRIRPAPGETEYTVSGASGYFDYFGAAAGDRGKGYYSYDLGDWHVVVLNTGIPTYAGSPQEQWLRADLAASPKRCTVGIWHYPLFSSYSTHVRSAIKPLWDALYDAGAELVVNGHYRHYERFAPQSPTGAADAKGIREFIVGTGGTGVNGFDTVMPNSQVRKAGVYGVLKLTLSPDAYSWQFVSKSGQSFTDAGSGTCHGGGSTAPTVSSVELTPSSVSVQVGATAQLTAVARDGSGSAISAVTMGFTSLNTGIATVSASGIVTGVAGGLTKVIATSSGKSDTTTVTVTTLSTAPAVRPGYYVAPNGLSTNDGSYSRPWNLATALSGAGGRVQPGDTVWMRTGTYKGDFRGAVSGTSGRPVVLRQYPGERATIDGTLRVDGHDLVLWGFEIMRSAPSGALPGLMSRGARQRFINMVIHDAAQQGVTFWDEAIDSEMYGSIVYNNGTHENLDHGVYLHNNTGTKLVADNVFFNNLAYGVHAYAGPSDVTQRNIHVVGNVSFNNGTISTQYAAKGNIIIGAEVPGEGMRAVDNLLYFSGSAGTNIQVGYKAANRDITVTGNTIHGGRMGLRVDDWASAIVQNNTIGGPSYVVDLADAPSGHNWAGNRYYRSATASAWISRGSAMTLSGWKSATGLGPTDAVVASAPTTTQVFVRPNKYEPGRALVAVYNFGQQGSVSVNLSGVLAVGQGFEVRNVQDFFGSPVVSGTYSGGTITIPMTGVAPPPRLGRVTPTPPRTGPYFDTFVVVPK
ncbi:MAG TPA: Ig-like domain-containing protein [Gemmatimonadaceae bacterium]|nr:Ig-like domain-containing protein [Gemmatimonadaceae bacterium]